MNISDVNNFYFNDASERCALEQLSELRMKNPKKVMLGHLNINSIPNKFEGIMDLVIYFLSRKPKLTILFLTLSFHTRGTPNPIRKTELWGGGGGGLLMYVNENIPSRLLKEHVIPNDAEIMCRDKSKETKVDYFRYIPSPKYE